jgi:hypothetical protein
VISGLLFKLLERRIAAALMSRTSLQKVNHPPKCVSMPIAVPCKCSLCVAVYLISTETQVCKNLTEYLLLDIQHLAKKGSFVVLNKSNAQFDNSK